MPLLSDAAATRPRSYTFVTGGGQDVKGVAQVNAAALWGLAAALRAEATTTNCTVAEVRVQLAFNRSPEARAADPRPTPLSHDLGTLVAGVAAAPRGVASGLHNIAVPSDVAAMQQQFVAMDEAQFCL